MNLKQSHIEINVGNYFKIHSTPLPVLQFLTSISLCLSSSDRNLGYLQFFPLSTSEGNLPNLNFFFPLNCIEVWENLFFCHPGPQRSDGPKPIQQRGKK